MPPRTKTAKSQDDSSKATKATKSQGKHAVAVSTNSQLPAWPPITPLIPAADLFLTALLDDHILIIPRLWTANLCKTYTNFLPTLPLVTTPGKPKKGDAVRVNDRFQIVDAQFADRLWNHTALKGIVQQPVIDGRVLSDSETEILWGGEVLGLNSNIRVYRYSRGQYFDQHCESYMFTTLPITEFTLAYMTDSLVDDDSNNIMFPSAASASPILAKTTWTLLLYLSSSATGCHGGETVFYPEARTRRDAPPLPVVAELEVGMALLHRHGKNCLLHEGREVTQGEKWVIRSDLCVKR